jgi:hypothetical protein
MIYNPEYLVCPAGNYLGNKRESMHVLRVYREAKKYVN